MALNDDSPPFAVLQQSAEDFKTEFDADIARCLTALNSKITALMCDPDSIGGGTGEAKRGNAHVEFSMAKYGILGSMRTIYEEAEKAWFDRLEDMKEEFIQNVELFLANTKLEVKLPALGVSPRVGVRKSTASSNAAKQDVKSLSTVSSLYPKLFNTAKNIPGLSSLLSKDEEEESSEEEEPQPAPVLTSKPSGRTPQKKLTIAYLPSPGRNGVSGRRDNQVHRKASLVITDVVEESEDEEEEPVVVQTPVKKSGRGRKSTVNTPASAKKETVNTPLRKRIASKKETDSDSTSSNEEKAAPLVYTGRRVRKSVMAQPAVETVVNSTPAKRGRPSKKRANEREAQQQPDEDLMEVTEVAYEPAAAGPKTPKQVHFALGLDPNEDLDIYSPEMTISRKPRRKTMVIQALDNFSDISLTPEFTRAKSKRKTFAGNILDQSVAPSPKRLKTGRGRSSLAPSASAMAPHGETLEANLLESEGASEMGKYSPWIPLSDIGGTIPALPGIYELKVAQAKKPAYIGACDSLRQKLTLHKLVQNSGHKHLDKFIDRNGANVLVRYEQLPSAAEAKAEEKNRVKNFVACYNTTPAYN